MTFAPLRDSIENSPAFHILMNSLWSLVN